MTMRCEGLGKKLEDEIIAFTFARDPFDVR